MTKAMAGFTPYKQRWLFDKGDVQGEVEKSQGSGISRHVFVGGSGERKWMGMILKTRTIVGGCVACLESLKR